jgi:glycosyltransferase involved in cell wall biosynthesis
MKKILLIIDNKDWAYDNIANDLIKFNNNNFLLEKIIFKNNQDKVFKIINKYDLVFPLAYQFFGERKISILSKFLFYKKHDQDISKFKNINYSKIISGIHSSHNYDNFKSTPTKTLEPNTKILNFLNNFKDLNCVSKRLKKIFSKYLNLTYTPNGVDENKFFPVKKNVNKKLTLGFVGSIKRDENIGYTKFIKEIAKEKFLDFKYAIAGTESYKTREELLNFYNEIDALIITSRSEGFPLRALEAMACGKPVISTKVSGCEDLIIENKNGFFLEYDLKSMLQKIRYIYSKQLITETMSVNCRKSIEREWSWSIVSKYWYNFIEKNL